MARGIGKQPFIDIVRKTNVGRWGKLDLWQKFENGQRCIQIGSVRKQLVTAANTAAQG